MRQMAEDKSKVGGSEVKKEAVSDGLGEIGFN